MRFHIPLGCFNLRFCSWHSALPTKRSYNKNLHTSTLDRLAYHENSSIPFPRKALQAIPAHQNLPSLPRCTRKIRKNHRLRDNRGCKVSFSYNRPICLSPNIGKVPNQNTHHHAHRKGCDISDEKSIARKDPRKRHNNCNNLSRILLHLDGSRSVEIAFQFVYQNGTLVFILSCFEHHPSILSSISLAVRVSPQRIQ